MLSASKGIVHPYYASALAPGTGASVGIGAWALVDLCRRRVGGAPILGLALAAAAVLGTLAAEVVLMKRYDYARWFIPLLVALTLLCLCGARSGGAGRPRARARRRRWSSRRCSRCCSSCPPATPRRPGSRPCSRRSPRPGPNRPRARAGSGSARKDLAQTRALLSYVESHGATRRFALLTVSAPTAAPMILLGHEVAGLAGYSGGRPDDGRAGTRAPGRTAAKPATCCSAASTPRAAATPPRGRC